MRLWIARKLCPKGWRVVPAFFTTANTTAGSLSWTNSTGAWSGDEG